MCIAHIEIFSGMLVAVNFLFIWNNSIFHKVLFRNLETPGEGEGGGFIWPQIESQGLWTAANEFYHLKFEFEISFCYKLYLNKCNCKYHNSKSFSFNSLNNICLNIMLLGPINFTFIFTCLSLINFINLLYIPAVKVYSTRNTSTQKNISHFWQISFQQRMLNGIPEYWKTDKIKYVMEILHSSP